MEKEELLLIHGTEYKEMTKEILYAAGLEAQIGARDKKIGIKPNLVAPSEAFLGATTHPEIVAGIIEYLQEAGFQNIIMLEGSWVGDKTRESMQVCGYEKLSEMYKVPFKDMQADPGDLPGGKKSRFSDQCTGDEGALPDEDHLCTEEYEGTASEPGKTSFSRDGTA